MAANSGDYTFLVLGDTHFDGVSPDAYHAELLANGEIGRNKEFSRNSTNWKSLIPALLGNARDHTEAGFVIHVGDMIQGDSGNEIIQQLMLKDALATFTDAVPRKGNVPVPFLPVIGNHDVRLNGGKGEAEGRSLYETTVLPTVKDELARGGFTMEGIDGATYWFRRDFVTDGVTHCDKFLFLDYSVEDPLAIIQKVFAQVKGAPEIRYKFVICHKAVSILDPAYHGNKDNGDWLLSKNAEKNGDLAQFCRINNMTWVSGHIHRMAWKKSVVSHGVFAEISVNSIEKPNAKPKSELQNWPEWQNGPDGNHRYALAAGFVTMQVSDGKLLATFFSHDGSVLSRVVLR